MYQYLEEGECKPLINAINFINNPSKLKEKPLKALATKLAVIVNGIQAI